MVLPIVLLVVGFALVIAEVFFVSLGLLSVMAAGCIVIADVLAFEHGPVVGWTFIVVEIVGIPMLVWGAFRVLPRLPFGRNMLLAGPTTPPGAGMPALDGLVGRRGTAATDLRPSGTVVETVSVEGSEVRVRAVSGSDPES